jgi:SET domain-containing protein
MRGYGLIAHNNIAADAIIGEYTGELKRVDEHLLDPETEYYCYIDIGLHETDPATQAHAWIDATDKGSIFRFMNHSCGPNTKIIQGRIGIHTRIVYLHNIRAIKKGEQLTIHYGDDWWTQGERPCLCAITKCVEPPPKAAGDKDEEVEEGSEDGEIIEAPRPRAVKSGTSSKKRQEQTAREGTYARKGTYCLSTCGKTRSMPK